MLRALVCVVASAWVGAPVAALAEPAPVDSLSTLLKAQTEAFSEASQSGDKSVLGRLLDPDVVFTNETGVTVTRDDILSGAAPPNGPTPQNRIINWRLRPQGDVATATFTDVVTREVFGHSVETRYRSTETWARRAGGWKMIASDTAYVPHDPTAVRLTLAQLDEYVGVYQLAPELKVSITRIGDGLVSSINGAAGTPLSFEAHDVAFTAGGGNGRRLFVRGPSGKVEGYLSSRDGASLRFDRIG